MMNKPILLLSIIFLLCGCPGAGREGAESGERRSVFIDGDNICFTINKAEILSRYILSTNDNDNKKLLVNDFVNLSYPNTCFKTHFEKGVVYGVSYTINKENYYDTFIFDKDDRIIYLGR